MKKEELKQIVKETILEEMATNESFFSRIGAAWDTAKDKMMGMAGSVADSYKKEKAFDLYKKYRTLFCKANQLKAKVAAKSKTAFGPNGSYQDAKQLSLSEAETNVLRKCIQETLADESFWSGLKNLGKNFGSSIKNGNALSDKIRNMEDNYHQGDVAGDAASYSQLFGDVNRARAAFVGYCKQNGFDPKAIAQEFKNRIRQDVVSGKDKSKESYAIATNGGKEKIQGTAPSADSLNASRARLQAQRNQTNQSRMWEQEK